MAELTPDEKAELRKAAEACPGESQQVCFKCQQFVTTRCACFERHRFALLANPATILALLDENARLAAELAVHRADVERQNDGVF